MTIKKRLFIFISALIGLAAAAGATVDCTTVLVSSVNVAGPAIVGAGVPTNLTFAFTVGPNGLQIGDKIALRIPDNWALPVQAPGNYGFTSTTDTANFRLDTSSQAAILTATTTVPSNALIHLAYLGYTCDTNNLARFRVFTLPNLIPTCSQFNESFGNVPNLLKTVVTGTGVFLRFNNDTQLAQINTITPITIRVTDACNNVATATSPITFQLDPFPSESIGVLSLAQPPAFSSLSSLVTSVVTSTTVFYLQSNSPFSATNRLQLSYIPAGYTYLDNYRSMFITNVAAGLTNVSVDNGSTAATSTSTTFSPDQDGVNDFAYINFTIGIDTNWTVTISSNNDFSTVMRQMYGFGRNNRISWDGYSNWTPTSQPEIATPGLYYIKIDVNGLPSDTSLTANLQTGGFIGTITDASLAPVANANVNVWGPTGRNVRTKADGTFKAYGLRAGSYNYSVTKDGYASLNDAFNLGNNATVNISSTMTQGAVVHISVSRPNVGTLNEIWGSVNANTSDWKYQSYGSIHFVANSTTSDGGDLWNAIPSTFTSLSLVPGQTYTLKFQIPNLGVNPMSVGPLTAGSFVEISTGAARRGNIIGQVCVPAGTSTSNFWINVEAAIDTDENGQFDSTDPSSHYFGNAQPFQNGATCSTYTVFGLADGIYTIVARAPLLAPIISTAAVISNGADYQLNLGTFTTGASISGTIIINGDTTNIPSVPINAWSPTTNIGAYQTVPVPASSTGALVNFSLGGLVNGTYNIWTTLPGYELNPPGQKTVTVVSNSAILNLDFEKFGGSLTGTITVPGNDYAHTVIEMLPYDTYQLQIVSTTPSSGNYLFTGLGTGYYTLRAIYIPTGYILERNLQIVNGQQGHANLDVTGPTWSISGTVRTAARSPYDTLTYLVANGTTNPTGLFNSTSSLVQYFPANRIEAHRLQVRDDTSNPQGGGGATAAGAMTYDPHVMFFGYYDASGSYTIPHLTPGIYLLSNNGEMDANTADGNEIAETARVVTISTSALSGQDFTLSDGFDVSGRVTVDSGLSESGRNLKVDLKNAKGDILVTQDVYLTGTSQTFTLNRIPAGSYVLTVEDIYYPTKKYAAKDVSITIVSAGLTNQEIKLLTAAKIQGQLRVKATGELLTAQNFTQYLPTGFHIEARSNPWFQGGWGNVQGDLIGPDNTFSLSVSPGTYDIVFFNQTQLTSDQVAQGKKLFVPVTVSGLNVTAGQTTNLGVIDLREGVPVSGMVTDVNGTPLPNIHVVAESESHNSELDPEAFTDRNGSYTLQGLDPESVRFYDIVAAPRPNSDDQRFSNTIATTAYAESRRSRFDTKQVPLPPVNFKLDQALGSISGSVTIPAGSSQALLLPFDKSSGISLPGADVILNKHGDIPQKNPLGNIEENTNPDGTFTIKGLAPGVYDMWMLALNYGSAIRKNILVGAGNTDIGVSTVTAGFKMSGTLQKADGTPLNSNQYHTIVGVRDGFEEIVVGQMNEDASGNITGYTMSGFQSGRTYSVLLFSDNDDVVVLASTVTLTGDTVQNFTVGDISPVILTQATKNIDGSIAIQFELTQALRNSNGDTDNNGFADDSEFIKIIKLKTGTGTLAHDDSTWMTPDRKHLLVTYTPAAGETSFVLTASCTFVSIAGTTGFNQTRTQDFTYFVGIGKQRTVQISNAGGGTADLDADVSQFQSQSGTFGDNSNLVVDVQFRSADDQTSLSGQAALGASAMSNATKLGIKAYPSGMGAAIQHLKAMDVDPFGSFYDLVLPAGVSHFFPQGKDAKLCLKYDNTAPDPYSLNIYYFNEATNEYLLEDTNKAVDTDNERICVSIAHASVFTVLASSQSILSGGGYTGELKVVNFPNPFNLKQKTVTLQNPGSNSASQTIGGTMIKMSIPTTMAGSIEIQIFNVAGEKVRTLHSSAVGGAHYYMEWDGKNESGTPIASGVYIGRFTIGGSNEKFFKMAVVK